MSKMMQCKMDGKAYRKTKRVIEKVKNELDIEFEDIATCCLIICNAGLTTGTTYEELTEFFEKYGPLKNLLLLPDKSFSFIEFCKTPSANEAYDSVHATLSLPSQNNVLYLAYVNKLPRLKNNPLDFCNRFILCFVYTILKRILKFVILKCSTNRIYEKK